MQNVLETHIFELMGVISEHALKGRVHIEEPTALIHKDALIRHLDNGFEDGLADLLCLLMSRVMDMHISMENTRCSQVYQYKRYLYDRRSILY